MGDPALCRAAIVKQNLTNYQRLLHITTYCYQKDQHGIVAKGKVGAVDLLDFIRTVCLDRYGKQEFQLSIVRTIHYLDREQSARRQAAGQIQSLPHNRAFRGKESIAHVELLYEFCVQSPGSQTEKSFFTFQGGKKLKQKQITT